LVLVDRLWNAEGLTEDPALVVDDLLRRPFSLAEGVDAMNEWEEVARRYEEAMAEHDALHAFVAYFSEAGRGTDP